MRCIFCKEPSDSCRSKEHIIPEALGNTEHLLPEGIVCDNCNSYFGRKIEGPLLGSIYFAHLRSRQRIMNKRNIVPPQRGWFPSARIVVKLQPEKDGSTSVQAACESDEAAFVKELLSDESGSFYIPISGQIDKRLITRFLGKVGLEVLAQCLLQVDGWNEELVEKRELDELRRYVRRNEGTDWPVYERRIYAENHLFDGCYQTLHEYTLLMTPRQEIYSVVCIFGMEYTINLGGRELDGYEAWLKCNDFKSPLYCYV